LLLPQSRFPANPVFLIKIIIHFKTAIYAFILFYGVRLGFSLNGYYIAHYNIVRNFAAKFDTICRNPTWEELSRKCLGTGKLSLLFYILEE
jgi:hypothetical protein